MEKAKSEEFSHNVYVMNLTQLYPLKEKEYTLTSLGESKVKDQPAVGVKVSRKGRRDVSLFFDKKTGLLIKSSTRVHDEFANKEVTQDVYLSNYRDLEGRKVFDRLTIERDGKPFVVEEFSDPKTMDKVDPGLFAKPKADK
jgi:hypothetical protein